MKKCELALRVGMAILNQIQLEQERLNHGSNVVMPMRLGPGVTTRIEIKVPFIETYSGFDAHRSPGTIAEVNGWRKK